MATRTFDYAAVSSFYQEMNSINADIADILTKIDKEVKDKVDVSEEAIFGDLGKQMLLDWDNTSANFDNFVNKFNNWSTLVTQAAGDYSQFESDISGFKQLNPLGVTSGGITDAYTNTGFYRQYTEDNYSEYVTALSALKSLNNVDLSGIFYGTTDSQAILTKHKIVSGIMLGGDILAGSLIALKAAGCLSATSSTSLVPVNPTPTGGGGSTALVPANSTGASTALVPTQTSQVASLSEFVNFGNSTIWASEAQLVASQAEAVGATGCFVSQGAVNSLMFVNDAGNVVATLANGIFTVV